MLLSKTVVGLFKDRRDVDAVVADLHTAGIPKGSIKVVDQGELAAHENLVGEEMSGKEGVRGLLKRHFGLQGFTEFEHGHVYTEWVRNGGFLTAVNTDDGHAARVADIMEGHSNVDVTKPMTKTEPLTKAETMTKAEPLTKAETMAKTELGRGLEPKRVTETMRPADIARTETLAQTTGEGLNRREEQTIPVIQEELHVGKRIVRRSSVRVIKHVTEMPVEETINLRDERVTVDRHPVERIAGERDIRGFADSEIEMIETTEEPVVSKEARVVEEITISKSIVDHEEKIRDKVRKTVIDFGGLAPENARELGFKKDFNTRFGKSGRSYSEYAPAYDFGSALASDTRYSNRDWASMESESRRLWEAKGRSWKEYGDAIRHGWESTRRNVA
jgi:stress response protein YsnF